MHFREATAADREAILQLRRRCFGDVDREKGDPRFWQWEFARARMFVGEANDGIATHVALLEWPQHIDGKAVRGALAVDAMTSPDARGQGAFTQVMELALRNSDHIVATAYQIRGAVLGAMLRSGWAVAERIPLLLRPAALWKEQPSPNVRTLTRNDLEWMGTIARSPEFLAWRFFDNPCWTYRLTGIDNAAYLVARRTRLKGLDTYAIVDLGWRDVRAAKALLRDAVRQAREEGCLLTAALVSRRHPAFGLFLRRGFVPGPHWFRLLVHPPALAKQRWRVMWADTDHL